MEQSASADPTPPDDIEWVVRAEVYRHFASTGQGPSNVELARAVGISSRAVEEALRHLEDGHHLALFPDRHEVWMAHPFSAVPTDFPVDTAERRYWANCAWDALGIPAILGVDGWTEARCAATGERIAFGVRGGQARGGPGVIHMVVPPREAWDDIGFT
jgi:hypothetical protein